MRPVPQKRPKTMRAERRAEIKKAIELCEGHVGNAAELLGITRPTLSTLLNHADLYVWWTKYKEKRIVENARARRARAYYRQKVKALLEAGYDPETAHQVATAEG
jgi:hypothetical protein